MTAVHMLRKLKQAGLINPLCRVNHLLMTAALMLAGCTLAIAPNSAIAQDDSDQGPAETFSEWRADFTDRAVAKGHDRAVVENALADITPLERTIELDRYQPEFVKPIWSYLDGAVSQSRQTTGKERLVEEATLFDALESEYGTDRHALTAIWGLESAFGVVIGNTDVFAALATLAWDGRRRDMFENELLAALTIIESGAANRDDFVGGWAGAIGQTQFMPTTFVAYAVDFDNDGRKDLWANRGDALASAANYLKRYRWRLGEPWGVEVRLPEGFDYAMADGRKLTVREWTNQTVSRANGRPFTETDLDLSARLLLPAGATGPAFLTFHNFDVIKYYNNSTAYALGVGLLSDAISGRPGLVHDWPRHAEMLTREDVESLQATLARLGFDPGRPDGRIGPNTRKALRAWQTANGLPADAFATKALLTYMRTQL